MKTILPLSLLIKPSKNDPRPLIIYHGRNCPDGFAAALAAWQYYAGQAEFLGLDHGDIKSLADLPALDGRAVYILDFSFAADILRGIEGVLYVKSFSSSWNQLHHAHGIGIR